jgi:hypothetical protein
MVILFHCAQRQSNCASVEGSVLLISAGTPGQPLGGCLRHFNVIEANMKLRREEVMSLLNTDDECVLSMTCFPR